MEWYYLDKQDQQVGPVTEADLQDLISKGIVKKETMVWNESMESWLPSASSSMSSHLKNPPPPSPITTTPRNAPPAPAVSAAAGFGRDDSLVYPTNPPRSPHMTWLNLLGPGLAQIVFGKTPMGITGIITMNVIQIITTVAPDAAILGILILPLWIVSIVDGYMTGNRLKEGTPVGKWQFFPGKKN